MLRLDDDQLALCPYGSVNNAPPQTPPPHLDHQVGQI